MTEAYFTCCGDLVEQFKERETFNFQLWQSKFKQLKTNTAQMFTGIPVKLCHVMVTDWTFFSHVPGDRTRSARTRSLYEPKQSDCCAPTQQSDIKSQFESPADVSNHFCAVKSVSSGDLRTFPSVVVANISTCHPRYQNRNFKPIHDVFQTLTKWCLCLNQSWAHVQRCDKTM